MTSAHILYIPIVALAGIVLGFVWGRKAALQEAEAKERLREERREKRRARQAKD